MSKEVGVALTQIGHKADFSIMLVFYVYFTPFRLPFVSNLRSEARAKAERRQNEGRTEAERKRSVCRAVIIKRKKQGATFEKMDVKTD